MKIGFADTGSKANQRTLDIQNKFLISVPTPTTKSLNSISGKDHMIAVGEDGIIIEYDEANDAFKYHANNGITTNRLNFIDTSIGYGFAIGDKFTVLSYDNDTNTFSLHSINGYNTDVDLFYMWFPYSYYGVLYDILFGRNNKNGNGVIYIWNGGDPQLVYETKKGNILAAITLDWQNYVAAGLNGGIYLSHDYGVTWEEAKTNTTDNFMQLGGLSWDKIWIISLEGGIYLFNYYTKELKLVKKTGTSLTNIWMADENDGYAVGFGGSLFHYDGVSWERIPTGTAVGFNYIYGSEENKYFIAGNAGYIFRFYSKAYPSLMIDNRGNIIGTSLNPIYTNIVPYSAIRAADTKVLPSISGGVEISSGEIKVLKLKSLSSNSGDIYVGDAPYSGHGYIIEVGGEEEFNIDNMNKIKAFATVSGDVISFYGLF